MFYLSFMATTKQNKNKLSSKSLTRIAKAFDEKALVIWGTNLGSSVGLGRFTKQESKMVKFPPYQLGVIIGILLSDGWLNFASSCNKNARLGFGQSIARSEYLWFVFNILSHYCSSMPLISKSIRNGTQCFTLKIFTRSLLCFTELHLLFYVNKVKVIPDTIYDLLTPVALAHWISGDGKINNGCGLVLCTDSYTIPEVVRLMNVLMIKYRLECTLQFHTPTQPRIYIRQRSMPLLRPIVIPYMHSSMYYKLGL
jgi:hypothetical protein